MVERLPDGRYFVVRGDCVDQIFLFDDRALAFDESWIQYGNVNTVYKRLKWTTIWTEWL
jgi:predicted phosphatase